MHYRYQLAILVITACVFAQNGCNASKQGEENPPAQAPAANETVQTQKPTANDAQEPAANDAQEPAANDAQEPAANDAQEPAANEAQTLTAFEPSPLIREGGCPENALKTEDGECTCAYGIARLEEGKQLKHVTETDNSVMLGPEFKCTDVSGEGDCNSAAAGVVCPKLSGCATLDGRWFPALEDASDSEFYYVPGGMDTTLETLSSTGNCVLDRTDNLPLFSSLNEKTGDFACDRPTCDCGSQKCKNGEVCKSGKCEIEPIQPIALDDTNSVVEFDQIFTNGPGADIDAIREEAAKNCKQDPNCYLASPEEDEEGIDEDNLEKYSNREYTKGGLIAVRKFDGKKCVHGKRYCHGTGNFPLAAPQNSDGYLCSFVSEMPGYGQKDGLKTWVCDNPDGCICGGKPCGMYNSCVDEVCVCGGKPLKDGEVCDTYIHGSVLSFVGVRCAADTCECGENTCSKGKICKQGNCYCDDVLSNDMNYICKENVSGSGKTSVQYDFGENKYKKKKIYKTYSVCNNPDGCQCGEAICPQNARCEAGQCICGTNKMDIQNTGYECQPLKDTSSILEYDFICKEKEGCHCGHITSATNMGCVDGHATCAGQLVPGRGLSCRLLEGQTFTRQLACFKDNCDCYGKEIKKDEICEPLQCPDGFEVKANGCSCGGLTLNTKDYICSIANHKSVNVCMNADGCACDETTCPTLTICKKGECLDRFSQKPIPEGYISENGLPKCQNETCACGKNTCDKDKYCLNGTCFGVPNTRKMNGKVLYYKFDPIKDKYLGYSIEENEAMDEDNEEETKYLLLPDENAARNLAEANELYNTLMQLDLKTPLCDAEVNTSNGGYVEDLLKYAVVHEDNRSIVVCENKMYEDMTLGDFLKNCGISEAPKDVATKYCHLSIQTDEGECYERRLSLSVSGWKDE